MEILSQTYRVLEYFITNEIPEVKSVDLFFNQFDKQDSGEVDGRSNPRILIQINEIEPIKMFGGVQNMEITVTMHIGIDIINNFASDYENKDKNLAYLSLLGTIYNKLSGLTAYRLPDDIKSEYILLHNVERSSIRMAENDGSVKVTEIDFVMIVEDNTNYNTVLSDKIDLIDDTITFS